MGSYYQHQSAKDRTSRGPDRSFKSMRFCKLNLDILLYQKKTTKHLEAGTSPKQGESQNHQIINVGKDLQDHQIQF